jgi:hypothetical protein
MDIERDVATALLACHGLRRTQLRTFVDAYERLNGPAALNMLKRACLARGMPWPADDDEKPVLWGETQ